MPFAILPSVCQRSVTILPEAASGWLRFGITALPKTAPPPSSP